MGRLAKRLAPAALPRRSGPNFQIQRRRVAASAGSTARETSRTGEALGARAVAIGAASTAACCYAYGLNHSRPGLLDDERGCRRSFPALAFVVPPSVVAACEEVPSPPAGAPDEMSAAADSSEEKPSVEAEGETKTETEPASAPDASAEEAKTETEPADVPDTSAEDAATAELRLRAEELAAELLRTRTMHVQELEQAVETTSAEVIRECLDRMRKTMDHIKAGKAQALANASETLRAMYAERAAEASGGMRTEVIEEACKAKDVLQSRIHHGLEEMLSREQVDFDGKVNGLAPPLESLNALYSAGRSSDQISHASSVSSSTVISLDSALQDGHALSSERTSACSRAVGDVAEHPSRFVPKLLDLLPPETVARGKTPLPTEAQLQHNFKQQMSGMSAAALTSAGTGLLGSVVAFGIGQVLGPLLCIKDAEGKLARFEEVVAPSRLPEARHNLRVLASTAVLVENGALADALSSLEQLRGPCKAHAQLWVKEVRHALLLQQVARAAQAHARCLLATEA